MVDPMVCPRCEEQLEYVGTKKFHEGTRGWGFALGDLGELFVNRESFDVYCCGRCGRVELFIDGIGEEFPAPLIPPAVTARGRARCRGSAARRGRSPGRSPAPRARRGHRRL